MIPIKLIALVIVTFSLAGLMVPAGVSKTAVFAQSADEIIENVESLVSEEITAFLDEDDEDGNGEEEQEEVETEEDDDNGGDEQGDDSQNIDQDNINEVDQDSSANDNILVTENEFGDDTNVQVAVPIVDQDQTAENRAANIDLEILTEQQPPTPTPTPPDDGVLPPEEDAFFCFTGEGQQILCFESLGECQDALDILGLTGVECEGFETLPEGADICTVEGDAFVFCPF
jgi:hypothetical protein